MNHVLRLVQELSIKSKMVMRWSLREKKESQYISIYSVLNKISEYIYFYKLENITSYTLLLVFKIVESLQRILKNTIKIIIMVSSNIHCMEFR